MKRSTFGNDTASVEIEREVSICPQDIGKILTSEGAMARSFMVGEAIGIKRKNVVIKGYTDFYGGYGNHCREVVLRLGESNRYNVKLDPIKSPIDIHPELFTKMNWYANNMAFTKKDSTLLLIAGPGYMRTGFHPDYPTRKLGWTMTETCDVPPEIAGWLNNMDMTLCPTEVDVNRCNRAGVLSTRLCRIGYDETVYHPNVKKLNIANLANRYVFGYVGSWNYRKSVEDIVRAFCMAFTADDPVSLLLVAKYGNRPWGKDKEDKSKWGIRQELNEILSKITDDQSKLPHICVLDVPLHPPVIPHVYATIDALVGFSKGESTWLPGLELAGMYKPIIQLANEACGYMDYLADNRYMCRNINYRECGPELYEGTSEYYKDGRMGYGDVYELTDMMSRCYRERGTTIQKVCVDKLFTHVRSEWTWRKSIQQLSLILDE